MSIQELKELNIIKTVSKKQGKYSVNDAPYQTVTSLVVFLFKQRNIVVDQKELQDYLDELATKEKITEKDIQVKLQKMFGGEREVKTPVGYVDLVTSTQLIEAKRADQWKHACGQVIAYSSFFQTHEKVIYLFGECPKNIHDCYKLCKENNIKMMCDFW